MNFDYLINLFRLQAFGELDDKVSIEEVVRRYTLFPNEAIYIVDYKAAQIEPLSDNFHKIIGIDLPHKNDVEILYEHVHKDNIQPFLRYTERLIRYGLTNHERRFVEENDFNLNLYKTIYGRVILKSTTILQYDSENRVRYSVGKLMDVTGLIPFNQFGYKFTGPRSQKTYAAFEGLHEFEHILSGRELEILRFVGLGMRTQQIAEKLYLSRHTVDTHKRNIIRKLEASNSIDAFNKAQTMGLFKA
jgi:DNA-binding CsgD family transcriptional regulator